MKFMQIEIYNYKNTFIEADYTLDDSFWNDDSPAGN